MHYVMIQCKRHMFSIIMCCFLVNVFYEGTLINNCVSNVMAEWVYFCQTQNNLVVIFSQITSTVVYISSIYGIG